MLLSSVLVRTLIAMVVVTGPVTSAAGQFVSAPTEERVYDLPAQDLGSALREFAASSGLQVLYETSLAAGRRSNALRGRFTSELALAALLAGSDLVARRTDVDAVTIEVRLAEPAAAPVEHGGRPFLGALQSSVLRALCAAPDTRPGTYRLAVQLWITRAGTIQRAQLLGSTGDIGRDALVVHADEARRLER